MIWLRAQAGPFFVEDHPGFTFSGGPNLAIRWEIGGIQRNPTAGVAMLKVDNQRQRFLTVQEATRLVTVLQVNENRQLAAIVTFLLLTGARKREVLDAR